MRSELRPASVSAPASPSASVVWAVRRDWPTGDHEFVDARASAARAARALAADRAYWRRGPLRPRLSMVRISGHDFDLHATARRGCRAPDCPTS